MAITNPTNFDPLGGLTLGGLSYLASSQNGLNQQTIGQAGNVGLQGLKDILGGQTQTGINQSILGSYNNPYLQRSIEATQRPLIDQFQNQTLPSINQAFANAGSFGSGRQASLTGEATRNFENKLADIQAQQQSNAYNAAYQAAINAGGTEYSTKANAANNLYNQAAGIAQAAPWLQGLSGALTGSGVTGGNGSLLNNVAGGLSGALSGAGSTLSGALSKLFSSGSSFTPPPGSTQTAAGGYQWSTADGGQIYRAPDGSINVIQPDGSTQLFSSTGQSLGTLASDADIYGTSSPIDVVGSDTSWIDSTDWSLF